MRILVTGGAGFIASHIVDGLLEEGYEVAIIDNLSHGREKNVNPNARFYKCDITDLNRLSIIFKFEKPEILIHHAAQIDVDISIKEPSFDATNNVIGTINVLQCCIESGVKRIIYSSSAAVYGNPKYLPIDEEHPIKPISFYGVSKYASEQYIIAYSKLYGLKYVILRYANVYGPRQDSKGESGVVSIFIEKLLRGEVPVIYGDGEQTRDFIYVRDVVNANLLALKYEDNVILNTSTSTPITINELINVLSKIFNKKIDQVYVTKRKGDILNSYLYNSNIIKILQWRPKYNIYEGIKETVKYKLKNEVT